MGVPPPHRVRLELKTEKGMRARALVCVYACGKESHEHYYLIIYLLILIVDAK